MAELQSIIEMLMINFWNQPTSDVSNNVLIELINKNTEQPSRLSVRMIKNVDDEEEFESKEGSDD